MSEREHYQPGVPCWVDTLQPDPSAAMRFYSELLGWEFTGPGAIPGDPSGDYFVAQVRERDVAGVGSQPIGAAPQPTPIWNTYISVKSADATAKQATLSGGAVLAPPFDAPPAGRMAVLSDPAGAVFCVWEAGERRGARLVNEPAAWAMSLLNTNDLEGSKAFYKTLFGWESEAFGPDATQGALWRLPGYLGGEPEQPVPRDVVAVTTPTAEEGSTAGLPPHWSVDFWSHDAAGAAATTARLGGTVIVPPFDTPAFRSTVLADPSGATFSVSQLTATG